MHDLVRLYAAEHGNNTHPARNRDAALERLTDFYLHTAAAASLKYEPTCDLKLSEPVPGCHPEDLPTEPAALEWFDTEHLCLLAAQQIAARHGWHARVWQLAWAMASFDRRQGRFQDQAAAWQAGLAAAENSGDATAQVRARHFLAEACALTGEHGQALDHLYQALPLAVDTRDTREYARVCHMLALVWSMKGNDQQALEHATAARDLYHALGDAVHEARALGDAGWLHARLGSYSQAQAQCEAACALHHKHGDRTAEAATLDSLGYIAHSTGDHQQAVGYYRRALSLYRDPAFRHSYREASTLDRLGHAHAALGQHQHAGDAWHDALRICRAQHRAADAERIKQQLTDLDSRPANSA
jgi:tetratricopeptide (TPR) repeat protein